ncbi:hypothetical protein NOCA250051 [metagenome]|uniref:Uncharacterized protein n=1 Tax=metagenome TaxID=256318 RepID=A0A2P2C8U0_9ZZZZ
MEGVAPANQFSTMRNYGCLKWNSGPLYKWSISQFDVVREPDASVGIGTAGLHDLLRSEGQQ